MSRKIHGVGINDKVGWTEGSQYQRKCYTIWRNMLSRCYNNKDDSYRYYGAQGVTVCDRWLRFSNFVEDIPNLVGWASWRSCKSGEYHLEKDIIQWGQPKSVKVYSPQTCFFCYYKYNEQERFIRCGCPMQNPVSLHQAATTKGQACGCVYPDGTIIEGYGFIDLARKVGSCSSVVRDHCLGYRTAGKAKGYNCGHTVKWGSLKGVTFYMK